MSDFLLDICDDGDDGLPSCRFYVPLVFPITIQGLFADAGSCVIHVHQQFPTLSSKPEIIMPERTFSRLRYISTKPDFILTPLKPDLPVLHYVV